MTTDASVRREYCTVTLTVPIRPDRERVVRAVRRWFELCPGRLHGEFGGAVRARTPAELDPPSRQTGAVYAMVTTAAYPEQYKQPVEWTEIYSTESWDELLARVGALPDVAAFEARTWDRSGRLRYPSFSVAYTVRLRADGRGRPRSPIWRSS
jgi:hypothetical protein